MIEKRSKKMQVKTIRKYLKKDLLNSETGEILNSEKIISMLDEEKIQRDMELMGYYLITTSEINMPDLEVIDTYHKLSKIED